MLDRVTIEAVLAEALDLGGDFAEVFVEDRFNTHFQMIGGRLEKGLRGNDFGIGIRVYFGQTSVYTYSNDPSRDTLIRLLRDAVYQKAASKATAPRLEAPTLFSNHHRIDGKRQGSDREKVDLLRRAAEVAGAYSPEVRQTQINYIDQSQRVLIANTDGGFVEDNRMRTRLSISVTAEHEGGLQTGMTNRGAHQDFSFYKTVDVDHLASEASRIAVTMAHAGYAPSGKMPVIIGNGFGGVLFHEASGHGLEATSVAKGISVYAGRLGERVASPLVTAIDDGMIPNAWGSQNCDDEGKPSQRNVLIEKGILKGYLVDRLNGRIMGMEPTGSARRQSYRYAPTSRMTNTYLAAGEDRVEEIIADTDRGLFAKYLGGGSVNTATGEFNFAVMEGYLIEKGRITRPVRGATLIGRGSEVLMRVDRVANDLDHAQGMCGSISGSIPVNVGQPTLRVSEITVGGRSE